MSGPYTLAAWYVPHSHMGEPRLADRYSPAWSQWELVTDAQPRFPGHAQPQKPAWGAQEEADADVMAEKIDAASSHGIDAFLFHWYHDAEGGFFHAALERGFMAARNRLDIGYALCWCNQPWLDVYPARIGAPPVVRSDGLVDAELFSALADILVEHHFAQPNYVRINGQPWFAIYDLENLLRSFGSVAETRQALQDLRAQAVAAGHGGVYLTGLVWKPIKLPEGGVTVEPPALAKLLGLDAVTTRSWQHHIAPRSFPTEDYAYLRSRYLAYVQNALADFPVPYLPCVSLGWDATPLCHPDDEFLPMGYPAMPVVTGNDPDAVREALQNLQFVLDDRPEHPPVLLIDSWNDWTHGSRLEPEETHGMAYLEAVRDVFG